MLLDDPDSSLMEPFLLSESFSVDQWFSTFLTQRPPPKVLNNIWRPPYNIILAEIQCNILLAELEVGKLKGEFTQKWKFSIVYSSGESVNSGRRIVE